MHTEILTPEQLELVKLIREFAKDYYLVGGTALALQLGHRRSIDFDLFTKNHFSNDKIIEIISKHYPVEITHVNQADQLTLVTHGVKMTWYRYEYDLPVTKWWEEIIGMPDMLTIACMKAFTLGRRAKWKDYVDMYFLFKQFSLKTVCERTTKLYGKGLFDEVLLRGQLSYFEDIDYHEQINYMPGFAVSIAKVQQTLLELASTEQGQ
ncbi:hypothetical protein KJ707_04545 [Patescibacteria group bacterium]|nr:hypothetical protein [Patescibacteria group bacterium]MBU1967424.1 hypothetical protein [Patescibacteria group bacterium]MBU2543802.1 hypothetical protein [Patescibacteria group bacterium]